VKDFSIFDYALKTSADSADHLGEIGGVTRRDFAEHENLVCHTTIATVEYACLLIENAILLRTNRSGRVYAGVEKLSSIQPIIDRYLRIADVSESVYLFGQDDWRPPRHPNIRTIPLNSDFRLAREWFLIARSSSLSSALVAFDENVCPTSEEQMKYWIFKTSNAELVTKLTNAVEGLIDWTMAA
jgi:hypothetical protein